jgi:hypothetical protein
VPNTSNASTLAQARPQRFGTTAYLVTACLTLLALAGVALVLGLDLRPGFLDSHAHRFVSALSLLAIATGYLILQARLRPSPHELLKRALLSIAFILWSISQLAPHAQWATIADDLAIALFVLDLSLVIWDELHPPTQKDHASTGPSRSGAMGLENDAKA